MKIFLIIWTIFFIVGGYELIKISNDTLIFLLIIYLIPFIIFYFKNKPKKIKEKTNKINLPKGRRATPEEFIKAVQDSKNDIQTEEKKENDNKQIITNKIYDLKKYSNFNIPKDIFNLLWFADGKFKNYNYVDHSEYEFLNGLKIQMAYSGDQEPSLIFSDLKIVFSEDVSPLDKIGYYPSYSTLTPEQRYIYLKWLENPFENTEIDIGYVFLFYYGLERYLFLKKSKEALATILRLLTVYKNNSSFFSYAFECLIFFCICSKNYNELKKLLEIYPGNTALEVYAKYLSKIPLYSKDLIELSSNVDFKNKRYIKTYPDLFNETLEKNMIEILGKKYIDLSHYGKTHEKIIIFGVANYSLRKNQGINIPNIISNKELKEMIYNLLYKTHEDIKLELKNRRKQSKIKS